MIKINFDKKLKTISGKDTGQDLYEIVANQLSMLTQVRDTIKLNILARKIYENKSIEVDEADYNLIEKYIDEDKNLVVFAKAAILESMQDAYFKYKEEKKIS